MSSQNAKHSPDDIYKLRAQYGEMAPVLADQLKLYPKAAKKVPSFSRAGCLFTLKSFEQSSSEATALYKSSLLSGTNVLDLSGGLGVDDWAFSHSFKKVISLDIDPQINAMARYNFDKLKCPNITRIDADAESFIQHNTEHFDLVYIDADRRPLKNTRQKYSIEESTPNVVALLPTLLNISKNILLKLSPMADPHAVVSKLSHVHHIKVVSHRNEVKELLVHIQPGYNGPIEMEAVELLPAIKSYTGVFPVESSVTKYASKGKYFYEPALSLIKSGLAMNYMNSLQIDPISKHTFYGLSDQLHSDFFGRAFQVKDIIPFTKKEALDYLKQQQITQANVAERNFPVNATDLTKLLRVKDGGDTYLFFTTGADETKLMIVCSKLTGMAYDHHPQED